MFDEPVNGLDPEGIQWIRTLMRSLAAQGRTVFVSSHLMSEMSQTADHLIVIGRGRLIADLSTRDFIRKSSSNHVRVRSPQADKLAEALRARGVTTSVENGYLLVQSLETDAVGDLAAEHRITIHELFEERATLEEAFMELTRDSVEYQAGVPGAAAAEEAR
jgi:ABC-2 type transport system ATP-binding protein